MAKPIPKIYETILTEYRTGQFSVRELAEKYKIKRGTLAKYISVNNIKISNNVTYGLNSLKKGIDAFQKEIKEIEISNISNSERDERKKALLKGFEYLEAYGEFGYYAINLIKKGIKKGNEMLDIAETPEQYDKAMAGIKKGIDTIGLFPKNPLVAIQTNIMNAGTEKSKVNQINVNFNFVEPKKENEAEIIEIEAQ